MRDVRRIPVQVDSRPSRQTMHEPVAKVKDSAELAILPLEVWYSCIKQSVIPRKLLLEFFHPLVYRDFPSKPA